MHPAPAVTIAEWTAVDGGAPAVVEAGRVLSRAGLNEQADELARGLAALGLRAGERAAWCGPNSTEVLVFLHACRKLGLVAVAVPYRLTAEEAHHVLSDSGSRVVAVDAEYAGTVARLLPRLPALDYALAFRGTHPAMAAWDDVAAAGGPLDAPPDEGAAMLYTSGTTGRPKGAIRGRVDLAQRWAMLAELGFGGPDEVHLVTGPLSHAGPHAFALLTHGLGGTVVVTRRFDPAEWVRLVGAHRVTSAFVAPVHLKRLLALPDEVLAAADVSSLRSVIVNAAPVPYALKQEVIARLGGGFLYEVYGSTELGIVTVLRPEDQLRKPGSCGRAYGRIGVRVVGDNGVDLSAGEVGEVFVRTGQAFEGYHGRVDGLPELAGEPGWQSVGDVGWLDTDGYLHLCDRKVDVVISGGVNVYPAEVEAALHAHPDVADVAVIGVPDDEWGERVHAVVVAKPGRQVAAPGLDAFLVDRLAGFKRPRSWDVRAALPRTESGKLLRRVLRAEHA